jgi:hypothetical protein
MQRKGLPMNHLSSSIDAASAAPAAPAAAPSRSKAAAKKATKPSARSVKVAKPAAKKPVAKKVTKAVARPKGKPAKAAKPAAKRPARPAGKPAAKPVVDLASLPVSPNPAPAPKQKTKLVRDSFTMPQADFALVDVLKSRALNLKHPVKKSELLRAGLQALNALDDLRLLVVLEALEPLKAGRPKKD